MRLPICMTCGMIRTYRQDQICCDCKRIMAELSESEWAELFKPLSKKERKMLLESYKEKLEILS